VPQNSSIPPESGFRIEVERPTDDRGPPWRYEGVAVTPSGEYEVAVVVEDDGTVRVEASAAPSRMTLGVAAAVRTVCRHSVEPGEEPPQRIVRWQSER
jgi:hypothetical protein